MNAQQPERIPVFVTGEEDIAGVANTREEYAQFREQNVVVTNGGRIVVVCQARRPSDWSDRSGQDLVCKTSTDNGLTWSQAQRIATHGLKSASPNAAVYDAERDRVHVLYNLFMWDFRTPPDHIRGEMGETDCRQYTVASDDEGLTWSTPRDITDMIGADGAVAVFGSGEGLQLSRGHHAGRLLISGGDFHRGKKILCTISDDHGETWRRGQCVPVRENMAMASETKVAELPDGTVILNSRTFVNDGEQRLRTRAFSTDGGETFSRIENDPALKTVSCNGSLIAVPHPRGRDGCVLLCSVPVGPGRTHGTIYTSLDGGRTWPIVNTIVDEEFAYSSLVQLPDDTIGLFYEARNHKDIRLVRLPLSALVRGGGAVPAS